MDELLARHTKIAIHRVQHGMPIERDAIYLIPPKTNMMLSDGRLWLSDQEPKSGPNLPIDIFLRSLAQAAGKPGHRSDPLRDRQRRIQGGPRDPRQGRPRGRSGPGHRRVRRHAQGGHRHGRRRPGAAPRKRCRAGSSSTSATPTVWRRRTWTMVEGDDLTVAVLVASQAVRRRLHPLQAGHDRSPPRAADEPQRDHHPGRVREAPRVARRKRSNRSTATCSWR